MNYYPHHIGDYAQDTRHLSMLEHGAYRTMLDLYYSREGPLPPDLTTIQRLACARSKDEREAVETVLREFFTECPDGWRHARCDREIEAGRKKIAAAQENGKRGGRKPKANPVGSQSVTKPEPTGFDPVPRAETQPKAPNPNPNPNNPHTPPSSDETDSTSAPECLPQWMPVDAWAGYLALRKAKQRKSPFTARARALVLAELERLRADGQDVAAVLDQSVRAGWTDVYPVKVANGAKHAAVADDQFAGAV